MEKYTLKLKWKWLTSCAESIKRWHVFSF